MLVVDVIFDVCCWCLQQGVQLGVVDREGLTPLDLLVRDRSPHVNFHHSGNHCY